MIIVFIFGGLQLAALSRWAQRYGKVVKPDFFADLKPFASRGEHSVFQSSNRKLAIKTTHPGQFGYSLRAEGLSATPLEYLERLEWQNHIFGDDIRLIGITGTDHLMQIVTSQPRLSKSLCKVVSSTTAFLRPPPGRRIHSGVFSGT
jgi:hypothetical protein